MCWERRRDDDTRATGHGTDHGTDPRAGDHGGRHGDDMDGVAGTWSPIRPQFPRQFPDNITGDGTT